MQTNSNEMTKATIDWKSRLLVQIADLQKEAEKVDVENGGLRTLGCITRITMELEKLNYSFRSSMFVANTANATDAFAELGQTMETAVKEMKNVNQ